MPCLLIWVGGGGFLQHGVCMAVVKLKGETAAD